MLLFFFVNNYQTIVEKDFIHYYIIAIKWGESTHFPGQNEPGRTGNRAETTRYQIQEPRATGPTLISTPELKRKHINLKHVAVNGTFYFCNTDLI